MTMTKQEVKNKLAHSETITTNKAVIGYMTNLGFAVIAISSTGNKEENKVTFFDNRNTAIDHFISLNK